MTTLSFWNVNRSNEKYGFTLKKGKNQTIPYRNYNRSRRCKWSSASRKDTWLSRIPAVVRDSEKYLCRWELSMIMIYILMYIYKCVWVCVFVCVYLCVCLKDQHETNWNIQKQESANRENHSLNFVCLRDPDGGIWRVRVCFLFSHLSFFIHPLH